MDHYFYSNKYHADKETLITTGATQSDLMLILNGHATVVRSDTMEKLDEFLPWIWQGNLSGKDVAI